MGNVQRDRGSPVVTVFGSSRVHPGDEEYANAQRLGELLGERGWTLCNGGHEGTMEAASRGVKERGGQTIGISISLYDRPNRNAWLDQELVTETLLARLEELVTRGEAYVVLPGGIGTLLELVLVWNLVQSPEFAQKPIIVVGESWHRVIATLRELLPMHRWEERSVTLVPTVEEAVDRLDAFFASRATANEHSVPDDSLRRKA
jgi:uncharacterized protein (TIGR00730 family)